MYTILVCYATGEGQTAKVADRIVDRLVADGHEAHAVNVADAALSLTTTDYDAVIVGASIHVGHHQESIASFVEGSHDVLADLPSAFFQVSLSSAVDDPERQAEAASYVEQFLAATDWHPDRVAMFGGALRYSKYGFLKRAMMKRIAADATGDTDTSRDYEYTDWDAVDAFADDFAALLDGPMGADRSDPDAAPEA